MYVNDTVSDKIEVTHRVRQRSVLGPLLFLIYINDLNEAISHYIIHHFADDTNILFLHKSLKKINKYINHDLSQIVQWQWLTANKILLNASKTEIILFYPKTKTITKHLNFRVSGQKINIVKQTKYLGIYLLGQTSYMKLSTSSNKKQVKWPSSKIDVLCQNRPFKNCVFCNFSLGLKICNTSLGAA